MSFCCCYFYKFVRIFDGNVSFALKYCEANFDKYQRNKKTTKWIFRWFLERAGGGIYSASMRNNGLFSVLSASPRMFSL